MNRVYACIDLKSFYASVECRERNLDPLTTNLVVADESRTNKTVCLAITPTLKQYGLSGRARLFEVKKRIREVNYERKRNNNYKPFLSKSYDDNELKKNKNLELDFIIAPPRMKYYMKYSTEIYNVYLKYIDPIDIYVYSIDEVFCDITSYLKYNNANPIEFVTKIILDVYKTTGITATAGIGTNLFLAKVAMDIVAKKTKPNKYGVRIAALDVMSYRKTLWNHQPLTSFWRVGKGYTKKLEKNGIYTMGDIAECSLKNEDLLYNLFGVNAELLIDHAWGYEPCTISDIKAYKPEVNSITTGQVLHSPYDYKKTKLIVREMADLLALDLVAKKKVTDQLVLIIGYDIDNLTDSFTKDNYKGEIEIDHYGRTVPKHARGTINIDHKTSSSKVIMEHIIKLFDKIINKDLLVRRINMVANNVIDESLVKDKTEYEQLDLFTNVDEKQKSRQVKLEEEKDEKRLQEIVLNLKNKYGKNAILRGMNLEEGGTTIDRNKQVGGHHE